MSASLAGEGACGPEGHGGFPTCKFAAVIVVPGGLSASPDVLTSDPAVPAALFTSHLWLLGCGRAAGRAASAAGLECCPHLRRGWPHCNWCCAGAASFCCCSSVHAVSSPGDNTQTGCLASDRLTADELARGACGGYSPARHMLLCNRLSKPPLVLVCAPSSRRGCCCGGWVPVLLLMVLLAQRHTRCQPTFGGNTIERLASILWLWSCAVVCQQLTQICAPTCLAHRSFHPSNPSHSACRTYSNVEP